MRGCNSTCKNCCKGCKSIERAKPLSRRPAAPTPRPRQFASFDSALCPAPVSQENEFRGGPRGSRFVRSAGFVRSGRRRCVAGRRSASRDEAAPRCVRRGSSADATPATRFSAQPRVVSAQQRRRCRGFRPNLRWFRPSSGGEAAVYGPTSGGFGPAAAASLGPAPRASARSARATTPGNSGNNLRSGLCRHWLRQISPRKGRAMNVTAARRRRAAAPTPWRFFFTIPWTLAVCHYGVHHFAPTDGACGGHLHFVFFQFAVPRRISRI